jgi:hypothetical protein
MAFADYRGLLFIAGGECRADGTPFDDVEAYDPEQDLWLTFPALTTPRHAFAAAVVGDKLYFVGGQTHCGGDGKIADTTVLTIP